MFSAASIATVPYVLNKLVNGMPQTATLFDKVIFPVGVPISNNVNAIAHDPTCRGSVTLSSGAGVFSNQCIFPKDVCSATAAHSITASAVSVGRNISGTIGFGGTTMTDSKSSFRSIDVGRLVLGNSNVRPGAYIMAYSNGGSVTLSALGGTQSANQ